MAENNSIERREDDVKKMFSRVSGVYDTVNRAMCCGLDILWRRRLVRGLLNATAAGGRYLDIACGSGDVTAEILATDQRSSVIGADFCPEMLDAARRKIGKLDAENREKNFCARSEFVEADCSNLPFADEQFDGATIAFGFRNFRDRRKCLSEILRVLKPAAELRFLEVARAAPPFTSLQSFFMKQCVPLVGVAFGGNWLDYKYLGETTMNYPSNGEVEQICRSAGFSEAKSQPMAFGFVAITVCKKSRL